MNYYFLNDAIQSEAVYLARRIATPKEAVLLTDNQVEMFVNGGMPAGKRRKAGTLELEDIPQPSISQLFSEEFKALKKEYDKDVQVLNAAFASAAMVDGPSQVDKQSSIRAQYNTRKAEYDAAVAALRTKYYG